MADVVYIVAAPAPYRNAELDRAAAVLEPSAVQLVFMEGLNVGGVWQHQLPQVCPFRVLDGPAHSGGLPLSELPTFLASLHPRVVIVGGYLQPAAKAAMRWCLTHGVPYALRSDANIWSDRLKGMAKFVVRRVRLGHWTKRAAKLLLTGSFNRQFWQRYGMRSEQEGWWPQWIDYDHYESARVLRQTQRQELRKRFGVQAEFNLLYVGRLIPRKRVELLCEAVAASPERVGLIVAGRGPQESTLRAKYGSVLGKRLRLLGAVEPADLPKLYAAADALALASGPSEPWGMVLNEATAAGLPIICHRYVGAAGDLLRDGENGCALLADTVPHWQRAIERVSGDAAFLEQASQRSMEIATDWQRRSDPAECLAKLLASVTGGAHPSGPS